METDILIIGGGPSTLAFLCSAYKNNKLNELMSHNSVAIIDRGDSFGGGNLGSYMINSNTSGDGFLSCLYKKQV